ncbi:MAG TPA: HlyD family efflux transporter periplasmic adaptor subunit [Longimicrobium sp.]|nr:HlyD family efflux transporter periplasmic adaptor subunit [Longimicrobium sp.]
MSSTLRPPAPRPKLLLPEVHPRVVGGGWVSRAVSLTLIIFALLLGGATAASILIRLKVTVDGTGALQPAGIWSVRAEEPGVIREVLVRMGDTVRVGQPIARLDSLQLASELDQLRSHRRVLEYDLRLARTSVPLEARSVAEKRAEADAELVRANAALRQRLVEHDFDPDINRLRQSYKVGTNVAIDAGLADVLAAEAASRSAHIEADRLGLKNIEQSRQLEQLSEIDVQIATLQKRISRLTLHAPATGIVLTDGLERLPGTMLQEGATIMEVAEEGGWRAQLLVAERDVSRIRVGDETLVELRAFGRVDAPEIRGAVQTVGAEPASGGAQSENRFFPVTVRLNPEDLQAVGVERLRRGYTAQAKIVTRSERMITLMWEYLLQRMERRRPLNEPTAPAAQPATKS